MRAISIKQPYASQIAVGNKRVEYRTWKCPPGPILIVASSTPADGYAGEPLGVTICTAEITKVLGAPGNYRWHLGNVRRVLPVKVRGYASIYQVDDGLIAHVPG
jgi:hypothetical protein